MEALSKWPLVLVVALLGACEVPSREHEVPAVPLASEPVELVDARPSACAECHAEIVAQWRDSLHAQAWTDPVFRAEYDPAPAASCRGCHDPPTRAPETHGIDCATCHVRDNRILAVHDSPEARAAHPIALEPTLASVDHCAPCHQFNFTDDGIHDPTQALQATVAEWRASTAASDRRSCQDCHMPAGSHRLAGLDDPQLLAAALDLELSARRTATGIEVEVHLRGARIGHAFPTGDVFRRGRLILRTDGGAKAILTMQRHLARTADPDGEDSHVRPVDDTRVPPPGVGELHETLHLADADASAISWRLELHRLPLPRARERGLSDELTVIEIDRGTLTDIDDER